MIYWFTGQPGSGKTTLGRELVKYLEISHRKVTLIDGDDLREIFTNKDYSESGRRKNIDTAQKIATLLSKQGHEVVVCLVSPYKDQREDFKKLNTISEIYVLSKEIRGRESFFVDGYEPPTDDYIEIDTSNSSIQSSFNELISKLDL